MSQLDELLARSRSPGRFVERRAFTLARDHAIAKQRAFALRHPEQYVLELVEAAVFSGATYIALDTRPNVLLLAWVGGQPLVAAELERLFDYLFADRGDPRWRHVVQLAVGVNAILERRPTAIRIESGDGATAVRVELDAQGRAVLGIPEEKIVGTYVCVTYGGRWFSPFSRSAFTAEKALVEERCLYSPVPIQVNGSTLFGSRGRRHIEIFGARIQEHFDDGARRGVVAMHPDLRAPTGFRIVVGGVWVTTLPLHAIADRPLVGVVCDDRLRKTADQSDIVEDEVYLEMLHAVQPAATRLLQRTVGPLYTARALPPLSSSEGDAGVGVVPTPDFRIEDPAVRMPLVEHARAVAHRLVSECTDSAERTLLAHLLGSIAVPQLVAGRTGPCVEVSLPVGWPQALADLPLIDTSTGPLSLATFVEMLGTPEVREVGSAAELARMEVLERRLGYGHLRHASLDGGPVFGAGRVGTTWTWLHLPATWNLDEITAVVWVEPAFRSDTDPLPVPGDDADWRVTPGPCVGVLRACRGASAENVDWEEGYRTLFEGLRQVESTQQWSVWARGPITAERAEGRGRHALLHLADALGRRDELAAVSARPIEVADAIPSDAGQHDILARLADALGDPPIVIELLPVEDRAHRPPVHIDPARSREGRVTARLNVGHPVVERALAETGAAREALLLELARQVCAWGREAGYDLDLSKAQQVLLGQRLG